MPTTWSSLVIGFILSLVGASVPYLIDMLTLTSLAPGQIIDTFHSFTLPMAEVLFVGVTMFITASLCVLDGLLGDSDSRSALAADIHALSVLGILAAFGLVLLYDHLLSAPKGSEFALFMSAHQFSLYAYVAAICLLSGLIQILILRNYLRWTSEAGDEQ